MRSKNLKYGHKRHNLDNKNLATILQHEKKHKRKIMNNKTMEVKRVFKSYGKT
jgi:hypothetical protein